MSIRVKIAKDKSQIVQNLVNGNEDTRTFLTYADVVAFAAALGMKDGKRVPLGEISQEPGPINLEVFITRGYDLLIKLVAIAETKEFLILSDYDPEMEKRRIEIFEEYANGGLDRLGNELLGQVDYTNSILLLLKYEKSKKRKTEGEFDLRKFINLKDL